MGSRRPSILHATETRKISDAGLGLPACPGAGRRPGSLPRAPHRDQIGERERFALIVGHVEYGFACEQPDLQQ